MFKKFALISFTVFSLSLVFINSSQAQVYKLSDYVLPDNVDQTSALQEMFNDALVGGGTVQFDLKLTGNIPLKVCGTIILWTPTSPYGPVGIVIEGNGTVIVPCENQDQVLFNAGNLTHLIIKNLTIASAKAANSTIYDMKTVVRTGFVDQFVLNNVTLAGITVPSKAIESYYSQSISIVNCSFGGNATAFALVYIKGARLVAIEKTYFHDYLGLKVTGNDWNYYSDSSLNYGHWVYVDEVHIIKTENVHFDEGAPVSVRIENSLFANFNFTSFDVSGMDGGSGVFLNNTKQAIFNQSSTGLTSAPNDLAVLKNSSKAKVNYGYLRRSWNANVLTGAKYVSADSSSVSELESSDEMVLRQVNIHHQGWMYYLDPNQSLLRPSPALRTNVSTSQIEKGLSQTPIETVYLQSVNTFKNSKAGKLFIAERQKSIRAKFENKQNGEDY